MPQMGFRLNDICRFSTSTASMQRSGSPGPLERNRPSVEQATNDIRLYATVYQHDLLARTFIIMHHIAATDTFHPVHCAVVFVSGMARLAKYQLAHHHALLPKHFGQSTRVDARNAWHMLAL